LIRTIEGHTEAIVDVAVSPDGQTIASASDDKTIKLWDIGDGKLLHTLQGGDEHVQGLDFSSDGIRLISSGRDKPAIGEFLQNFFGDSKYNKGVSMRLWILKFHCYTNF
jgi:WD40 repeat protein